MKKRLEELLPDNGTALRLVILLITVTLSGFLVLIGIYGLEHYGIALFLLTPFFTGTCAAYLYGLKRHTHTKQATILGLQSLGLLSVTLLAFAIEGLICLLMSAPLAILFSWAGSVLGYKLAIRSPENASKSMLILFLLIPVSGFLEKQIEPELNQVVTSIEIKSSPEKVWPHVIEFPQLDEPEELLFKAGIAYPISARIDGSGVGAVRHCHFTTGSFVEPITIWDEPKLLKFDVIEQPEPMKELSFWDVNAPHLHDYFVSKEGQFKLKKLPNGNTLLEGTTWYYHNIQPAFYWRLWSNHIIHKIHERVLAHIKENVERTDSDYSE